MFSCCPFGNRGASLGYSLEIGRTDIVLRPMSASDSPPRSQRYSLAPLVVGEPWAVGLFRIVGEVEVLVLIVGVVTHARTLHLQAGNRSGAHIVAAPDFSEAFASLVASLDRFFFLVGSELERSAKVFAVRLCALPAFTCARSNKIAFKLCKPA